MTKKNATFLAQIGNHSDPYTGAISAPIHLSTTYAHPKLGASTGFDYTRTKNPTRTVLEEALAQLEAGSQAVATSSGMAAIQLVFGLLPRGAQVLASRDLYGGSYRFFNYLEEQQGPTFTYFEAQAEVLELLEREEVAAVFLETPTNPLMQVFDIARIAEAAHAKGAKLIVDNTFLTPLRQQPLTLGADFVVHSGTKFLSGHNDLLAGVAVAKSPEDGEVLAWLANTTGGTLAAFDSWLFIRSLKTLSLRLERQESNARYLAEQLQAQPQVKEVLYPGIGGMISLRVGDAAKVPAFLEALKLFTFAESLGGVESLVTYPTTQTHGDIPQELRESYGLTPDLVRLSIGIEEAADLLADLQTALAVFE